MSHLLQSSKTKPDITVTFNSIKGFHRLVFHNVTDNTKIHCYFKTRLAPRVLISVQVHRGIQNPVKHLRQNILRKSFGLHIQ